MGCFVNSGDQQRDSTAGSRWQGLSLALFRVAFMEDKIWRSKGSVLVSGWVAGD